MSPFLHPVASFHAICPALLVKAKREETDTVRGGSAVRPAASPVEVGGATDGTVRLLMCNPICDLCWLSLCCHSVLWCPVLHYVAFTP